MKLSKNILIVVALFLMIFGIVKGQYKAQVEEEPTIQQALRFPEYSEGGAEMGWFDSERFDMQHSYSFSMGFGNNRTSSLGMYINNMSYLLTEDLKINARMGFMHDPLMGNTIDNSDISQNLIYGADVLYKPSKNSRIKISFDKQPFYNGRYYNNYYNSGFYNWR